MLVDVFATAAGTRSADAGSDAIAHGSARTGCFDCSDDEKSMAASFAISAFKRDSSSRSSMESEVASAIFAESCATCTEAAATGGCPSLALNTATVAVPITCSS